MGAKTIATELDTDSELYKEFESWSERYKSNSEAVRTALRNAMSEEGDSPGLAEQVLINFVSLLAGAAVVTALGAGVGLLPMSSSVPLAVALLVVAGLSGGILHVATDRGWI